MVVSEQNKAGCTDYESFVDGLVLERVEQNGFNFSRLLVSLPGIYPSVVLQRLRYLASTSRLDHLRYRQFLDESQQLPKAEDNGSRKSVHIVLPVEHPLDYEWRFGERAARILLTTAALLRVKATPIAMLGTPTVLRHALETGYEYPAVLIDKNPLIADCFAGHPRADVYKCDLLKEVLPNIESSVVIIDPPWYADYMRAFVWAAVESSAPQSHILMSAPPIGTRPNVDVEMKQLLASLEQDLGITLSRIDKGVLPYQTPLFERNALKAEGITNVPQEWRRGDLWILQNTGRDGKKSPRPLVSETNSCWHESVLCDVRIKIRNGRLNSSFADPSLKPLVRGEVLPSVSRRDARRQQVDVWTSGNRVYTCSAPQLLQGIAEAIAHGLSPYDEASSYMNRNMTEIEASMVTTTITQLRQIVLTEHGENRVRYAQSIDAESLLHNN
jgi:hypothetical protein